MLLADPALQELGWRSVAKGRMLSFPVIKHLDVLEARRLHVVMRGIANAMYSLVLKGVKPALRRRVVPAVPFAAHRAGHAVCLELVLKCMAGVLAAPVGMVHQARCWAPAEPGHGQRVCHDVGRHARFQRPAHNLAIEQIENNGQIQPAFIRPQIGDVRRPDLIRRGRRKVSIQQIARYRQAVFRVRRHLVAPLVTSINAVLTHQPFHAFLTGREAARSQFSNHTRATVGAFEFSMNGTDKRQHLAVGQSFAIRYAATLPCSIATDADIQYVARIEQRIRQYFPIQV